MLISKLYLSFYPHFLFLPPCILSSPLNSFFTLFQFISYSSFTCPILSVWLYFMITVKKIITIFITSPPVTRKHTGELAMGGVWLRVVPGCLICQSYLVYKSIAIIPSIHKHTTILTHTHTLMCPLQHLTNEPVKQTSTQTRKTFITPLCEYECM